MQIEWMGLAHAIFVSWRGGLGRFVLAAD